MSMHDMSDIYKKAAFWHTAFEAGEFSPQEQKAFDLWLAQKTDHNIAFDEMNIMSRNLSFYAPAYKQGLMSGTGGDPELTAMIQNAIDIREAYQEKEAIGNRVFRYAASIAAVLLLMLGSFGLWQYVIQPKAVTTYQTATGEQRREMLSDGSVIMLNTNSEIAVAMTDEVRRIQLKKGEVYFDVAKDQKRPFEVTVGDTYVRAVGTAFNIWQREAEISVLVTEGKVEVKSESVPAEQNSANSVSLPGKTQLEVGDQIILGDSKFERLHLDDQLLQREVLWQKGQIIFDQKTLREIVRGVQPYIKDKIVIADEEVEKLVAGGMFNVGKINSFFSVLEAALPVSITYEDDVIIIMRRPLT